MNKFEMTLLLCCLVVLVMPGTAETNKELIQKYLKETIDHPNYDKRIVPEGKGGPGTPVDVNVTMYFLDISSLNEQNMEFEAQFYFRQYWVDSRLQYNLPNVSKIVLTDVTKIWTPDLFFTNEKEGSLNKITQPNIFVRINPDGKVLYSIRVYEKLSCQMDLRNFPHDTQTCAVRIESYGFNSDEVMLHWAYVEHAVSSTASVTAFNFDLHGTGMIKKEEAFSTGTYSALEASLIFKRNVGFFIRRMYIPFVILVLLSWISFWISSEEKGLRLTLLLVVLYFMVLTTAELDRWIPYTPYSKASDAWIGCCEAFVFAAFLEFIVVAMYYKIETTTDRSWGNIELSGSLDNEAKELCRRSDSFKTLLNQINVDRSARLGRGRWSTNPVDWISRLAFPIIFIIFNIIYWSVYAPV